jgi:hypothetical protein
MEKIPTAEQIAYNSKFNNSGLIHYKDCAKLMNSFAKLHVQAALKAANENAIISYEATDMEPYINKDSILNAYPLENIK